MLTIGDAVHAWQELPWANATTVLPGRRALVLAPHPDDETIGCGGLIAGNCAAGHPPVVAILTDGAASHPTVNRQQRDDLRSLREHETEHAAACLGLPHHNLVLLGLPDNALQSTSSACLAVLEQLARARNCDCIVAPWRHDQHPDHVAAAAIAQELAAALRLPCLFYPTWGWVIDPRISLPDHAVGGWRVDISAHLPEKRRAIVSHESQYFGLPEDPRHWCLPAELLAIAQRPYEVILTA